MSVPIRLFLAGVSADDATPVLEELRAAGFDPECEPAGAIGEVVSAERDVILVGAGASTSALAAGVAHDLRNVVVFPLAMQIELAVRALRAGNMLRVQELVTGMVPLIRHGEAAVDRLARFGRQGGARERLSADELARRAVAIAQAHVRRARGPIELALEAGAPGELEIDAAAVVGAIVDLIVNAIEAMPAGGRVEIRTRPGAIEVADHGPGIAPDVQARLFEPFFTTKANPGSGLGLALVDACMKRHGGRVEVDTGAAGTRMRLYFPSL